MSSRFDSGGKVRFIPSAGDKGRTQFWENTPAGIISQFEKGPDAVNEDHISTTDVLGTSEEDLIGLDSNNKFALGLSYSRPLRTPLVFAVQPNASMATAFPFLVNGPNAQPLEITRIDCTFDTTDGAANTGFVSKEASGIGSAAVQAPGAGVSAMSGTFNLNATANTVQTATLVGIRGTPGITLAAGEQLTFNIASAVTNLKGLVVVVWMKSRTLIGLAPATYYMNAAPATKTIYLNLIPGATISAVSMRWSAAGTDGGTVTADVTIDTSTNAPGAGTSVLAAAQSVKGAANVTVYPPLAVAANLVMALQGRLAVKLTGTLTALAGLVVTVYFQALTSHLLVIPGPAGYLNQGVDQTLFISDGTYEVFDHWATWSVVSTNIFALLSKDTGTSAPGAGTALLSDNTNTGIDTSATANTPVEGTLQAALTKRFLGPGDRLGFKHTGTTVGTLANFVTATLLKRL